MKSHNGMRPQDVAILLKVLTIDKGDWQFRDLAAELDISVSEIAESLHRSQIAGLVDTSKRIIMRKSLMEFIEFGLKYVFPVIPGGVTLGMPTGISHSFYANKIESNFYFVWPDADMRDGVMGQTIQPLYKTSVSAAKKDELLYKLLASIDLVRIGKTREKTMALRELKKHICETTA